MKKVIKMYLLTFIEICHFAFKFTFKSLLENLRRFTDIKNFITQIQSKMLKQNPLYQDFYAFS